MTKEYNIAILGATGAVGEMIIEVLEERNFPVQNLFLLASKKYTISCYFLLYSRIDII